MLDQDRADAYAKALGLAEQSMRKWTEQHPADLPASSDGVQVGLMWELYRATTDEHWSNTAEKYGQFLEDRWANATDPSVISQSCVYSHLPWYLHSKNRERRELIFRAASELAKRFHHKGRFLSAAGCPDELKMSVILEVPVSFYTANETLDQDMARHATAHCRTTRDRLLDDDGGACSAATFQAETGVFARAEEPCRAHDVALALLGFSQVYGLTNAVEFLKVAERCAEYWLTHLPPDHIPYRVMHGVEPPSGKEPRDCESAAIAACTLLTLSDQTKVAEHAAAFRCTGLAMLDALVEPALQQADQLNRQSILNPEGEDEGMRCALGNLCFVKGLCLGQRLTD
jgi:unsaturated chondroitin disaccharide hydrolase